MRTPRPSSTPSETLPLSVSAAMRWRVLAFAVLSLFVVHVIGSSLGAFFHQLGSLNLIHGLMSEAIPNSSLHSAQRWFGLAGGTGKWWSTRPTGISQCSELAYLATLDPLANPYHPDLENRFHSERGELPRKAAIQLVLRRADVARHNGLTQQEEAWRVLVVELQPENIEKRKQLAIWFVTERGDILNAIAQYETALKIQKPTEQDYLRLIALNLKIGHTEQATYWHAQLQQHFPGQSHAWLHDLQGSFAQLALAEAYAYFGWLDDAIAVGERSLAVNDWDWGHRVVARFYQLQGRYAEAERHLLAAIQRPTNKDSVILYRVALGDLYAEEGQVQQAVSEYCRVLRDAPVTDAADAQNVWRANAVSRLAELIGVAESEVSNWCASR